MSTNKVYTQNNVMCAMLCVFVLTFVLGGISGWISCHYYEMTQEKMEIKEHMKNNKSQTDYIKAMERFGKDQLKSVKSNRAEGSMHSQDPRSGYNKVQSMNSQSGEDPDQMMVERMTPPDLEIAQSRNDDGHNTPYDRRHIESIANDPDERMIESFGDPFHNFKQNNLGPMEGVNWS